MDKQIRTIRYCFSQKENMGTNLLRIQSPVSKSPLSATFIFAKPYAKHSRIFPPRHQRSLRATPPPASSSDNNNPSGDSAKQPATTQPNAVEIRFRRRSRRRSRQQSEDGVGGNGKPVKTQASASASVPEAPPKKWEEMSMGEKAIELYVGEKGVLFWLNKFAYASIFIVIGGWILFRFVGPSLNLYQLDSAPLPPTSLFKGS